MSDDSDTDWYRDYVVGSSLPLPVYGLHCDVFPDETDAMSRKSRWKDDEHGPQIKSWYNCINCIQW
jgi:hypothetical protein